MKAVALALLLASTAHAAVLPPVGRGDARVRTVAYDPDQVIELRGAVGYSINLRWAEGEKFVAIASGHKAAISYTDERNHLFIKPVLRRVSTDLTVLTDRRAYHFDYIVGATKGKQAPPIYSLRFTYPEDEKAAAAAKAAALRDDAQRAQQPARPRNTDYWFCGAPSLRPSSAFDDGVQTRLRFPPGADFPAMFVSGDDGSESLLNFSVDQGGEVVIHRIAKRFVLRRGALVGCVVNKAPMGLALPTNATTPGVERVMREAK